MDYPYPLPAWPDGAPAYENSWPVRLGDTDADDRLRLDAVARYLQDMGFETLDNTPEGDKHPAWLVRRTVIDVIRPIAFRERVELKRWASATSNRWCNIRVQITGEKGGLIESEAFLINIDPVAMVPARMSDAFMAPMLSHTTEHRLRWKAVLEADTDTSTETKLFPLRVTDFDTLGHVNNAVYWQAVEEELALHPDRHTMPYRTIVEHVGAVMAGDQVDIRSRQAGSGLEMQLEVDKSAKALVRVERLPV